MMPALLLGLAIGTAVQQTEEARYLPTIQGRWDASDLVCVGVAKTPVRSGVTRIIYGSNRDQLAADIRLERCLKGPTPASSEIRVFGYSVWTQQDSNGRGGFAYAGPPTGFVRTGRNLLFLRSGSNSDEFVSSVPIVETAIPLADNPPTYPPTDSPDFVRIVIARELEQAILDENKMKTNGGRSLDEPDPSPDQYVDYLLSYLGPAEGSVELSRLSDRLSPNMQRDIAVDLMLRGHVENESSVIALLMDQSAPAWKRENAARALGRNGSDAALGPLRRVVAESAETDQLKPLHNEAQLAVATLKQRLKIHNR